jgi:hypothetical protein
MRRLGPMLAGVAIGATTLLAAPALAETNSSAAAQHKSVTLGHDDDWQPLAKYIGFLLLDKAKWNKVKFEKMDSWEKWARYWDISDEIHGDHRHY